jgi:hypothetical protein
MALAIRMSNYWAIEQGPVEPSVFFRQLASHFPQTTTLFFEGTPNAYVGKTELVGFPDVCANEIYLSPSISEETIRRFASALQLKYGSMRMTNKRLQPTLGNPRAAEARRQATQGKRRWDTTFILYALSNGLTPSAIR